MLVLTKRAVFLCDHGGRARPRAAQNYVSIDGASVLVEGDPVGRSIQGCPNFNPPAGIKQCLNTLKVDRGYSSFIRISKRRICLSAVEGFTDGTPSGLVHYTVHRSGQNWVRGA